MSLLAALAVATGRLLAVLRLCAFPDRCCRPIASDPDSTADSGGPVLDVQLSELNAVHGRCIPSIQMKRGL